MSINPNYKTFALQTAAPTPVHRGEVISVIVEELWACFSIGYGYALAVIANSKVNPNKPDVHTNEALSRADLDWSAYEREGRVSITAPKEIDYIVLQALESVKVWAKDVNAFYNNELLAKMIGDLCDDWFQIGTTARPDTFEAFEADFCSAVAEAIEAVQHVTR